MKSSKPKSHLSPSVETEVEGRPARKLRFPGADGQDACAITHAIPIDEPEQVHQITPTLFSQYEVDGGNVTLGGCLLEDVPFLRIETQAASDGSPNEPTIENVAASTDRALIESDSHRATIAKSPASASRVECHVFDQHGRQLDDSFAHELGLDYPETVSHPPSHVNPNEIGRWLTPLLTQLQQRFEQEGRTVLKCEIVWCKRADGKIALNLGEKSANIPFSGWARQLATGQQSMPPFKCPQTNRESYTVTQTESGELTVPDALKTCAVSGRRVLETELERCNATDRLCLPEYLSNCEATGKRVMTSRMVECKRCGQRVSPDQIQQGKCTTCQRIGARPIESERQKRLHADFPGLKQWKGWQFSESATCEVYQGYGWLKTLVLCIDKNTRKPRHLSIGGRLSASLGTVPESEWPTVLGTS